MYRVGQSFNEVEYLSDTAKTRYAVYNMVVHFNLLKPESENKYFTEHHNVSDIPDTTQRLNTEGALAISFEGKIPARILTSYGAIRVHFGQNNPLASTSDEIKFSETLQSTFGLMPLDANNPQVMVVTKLPWRESDLSILKLATPTAVIAAPEIITRERAHVQKVIKVVNVKFKQSSHPEFILRGVDNICTVNGIPYTMEQALQTYPNFMQTMERVLREEYTRLHSAPVFNSET